MLYVFHVDTGTMMTFDMSLAIESVNTLKQHVEKACKIPAEKQVLLVSGGESLDPNLRVCQYSAGTDTNPIFLFSKSVIESVTPPCPSIDYGSDMDLKEQVDASLLMPASYSTVVARAQLAHQFHELAREQTKICEKLVHDQHLQQQGWAAVVANLEDITVEFKKRSEAVEKSFSAYIDERASYLDFIKNFNYDLQTLEKIPLLPQLLSQTSFTTNNASSKDKSEPSEYVSEEVSDNSNKDPSSSELEKSNELETQTKSISLLQWISSADNNSSIEQLLEHCQRGLEQFDDRVVNSLLTEVKNALETSDKSQMKEVKGLGDRLYGLEQLMCEAKKLVQEQCDLAQGFLQNQNRASNLGDTSILPDLCISHRNQLLHMLRNHHHLHDIRRRCTRAKEELSVNLYHRLKWVMYVENQMLDTDQKLVIYHESLKRLRRHLDVLQQVHLAPATYVSAVAEVVRRRSFSQAFLLWASELACHMLTIHNDEVTRRKDFLVQFEGHFLNTLFPGMEDFPPSFATQAPSIFDSALPKLTIEDVEKLKIELPELCENLSPADLKAVAQFFLIKSETKVEDKTDDTRGVEEKLVQVINEVGLASNLDQGMLKPNDSETCLSSHATITYLKDLDKGCESETDTEEFEKVGQSPMELHSYSTSTSTAAKDQPVSPRVGTQDAATLTEVPTSTSSISSMSSSSCLIQQQLQGSHPPKKPPRSFQKSQISSTLSYTESFTNLKNPSLESIDESGSLKIVNSTTESQLNSPRSPPPPLTKESPVSPPQGHQVSTSEFVTDEFYIDESLPSSLSIEGDVATRTAAHNDFTKQLEQANNVVQILQENLQSSRMERDRLRMLLIQLATLSRQAITHLKEELNQMKTQFMEETNSLSVTYSSLSGSFTSLQMERDLKEREIIQRITVDHELEISDYRKHQQSKEEEIKSLRDENLCLEETLKKAQDEGNARQEEFDAQLKQKDLEKEKAVKEVTDKLTKDFKAEMESLRSRFRLMTNMERSPSDSSLEKIEPVETIVNRIREECSAKQEEVVRKVIANEESKWLRKLEEEKQLFLNDDRLKAELEDKDRQIELLRQREANLNLECVKLKATIHQLAENDVSSTLMEKLEALEREKCQLEAELSAERSRQLTEDTGKVPGDMSQSVAVLEGKVDATTSPIKKEKLTRSQTALIQSGTISVGACDQGDRVLVLWNSNHQNYIIIQESSHIYFLHPDSLESLDLSLTSDSRKIYCIGEVIDKEFCHAKRSENRYKVPKGTKFYRVKIRPVLSTSKDHHRGSHHSSKIQEEQQHPMMSQSQTTLPSQQETSAVSSTSGECHSLPSSPTKQTPEVSSTNNTKAKDFEEKQSIITEEVLEESTEVDEENITAR